jgi:hypothetical protein
MLVHMTPGEVHGLQSLALSHGGSLTINPETGLVEAGFLSKILPTILGLGLSLIPGVGPLAAAGIVGAGETIRTGDLGKGLMAGLGAYGGAGLGSAVSGVGSVASTAAGTPGIAQMAPEAFKQSLTKEAVGAAAKEGATKAGLSSGLEAIKAAPITSLKAVGSQLGTTGVAGLGLTAANAMTPDMQIPKTKEEEQMYWESQGYDPSKGFLGGRFVKGYPGYNPDAFRAAQGGVIPAPNQMYPMANIQHSEYATSIQNPRKTEVVGGYDAAINPFTGEETRPQVNFAEGGETTRYQPRDPGRGDTGGETTAPQGGLREYYQSLLQAPTRSTPSAAPLANYINGLNQFVTSPVVAPKGVPITPGGGASTGTDTGGTGNERMPSWTINPVTGEPMDLNDMITGGENQTIPWWRRKSTQPTQPTQSTQSTQSTQQTQPTYTPGEINWDSNSYYEPNFRGSGTWVGLPTSQSQYDALSSVTGNKPFYSWEQLQNLKNPAAAAAKSNSAAPEGGVGPTGPAGFDNPFSTEAPVITPFTRTGPDSDFVGSAENQNPPTEPADYWDQLARQGGYQGDATMMYAGGGGIRGLQYAAAGKLLRGPGDGMSDSIKANIGGRQEARLADGEFVVPADVVSHLGNGSTEAGSRKLYKMMDNIRRARTGRKQQAPAVKVDKYLPK